ncbi:MAG: hypothetical protein AMJ61_11035 [Desulfobacterales bacterium SG8_35_2]|nr:MAG: hypothetical protein AMJ61_11035 [Desulfobacterales bacterium SG8_35_2]
MDQYTLYVISVSWAFITLTMTILSGLEKIISSAFPHANTGEDNLKPGNSFYSFKCECYKGTGKSF